MNTEISALKKKIDLKEQQRVKKEEMLARNKTELKKINSELEALRNELANEEMQEIRALMNEKEIGIDDVMAAIASGTIEKNAKTSEPELKEINTEDNDNV